MKKICEILILTAYCVLFQIIGINCFAQNISVRRGPYLQVGTPNSMVVRWRTDSLTPVNSRVYYGLQPDTAVMSVIDSVALTTEHEVKITGLSPNTRYYYAIATSDSILTGPDSMQYFQTSPSPGTVQPVRVWAIGDCGEGNQGQRDVRDAYKNYMGNKHTDVWLWLGDNAYDDGRDYEYQTKNFEIYPEIYAKTVLWPSPGNHDYGSTYPFDSIGPDPYFNNFTMPANGEAGGTPSGTESFYSFNYGNVHFISLNSEDYFLSGTFPTFEVNHSDAMISWLEQDLVSNTNKDWVIAYWHQTPYSHGTHSEEDFWELAMRSIRDNLVPVLEKYGVDLVLCGHSHNYERSYLIHGFYITDSTFNADSTFVDTSSGSMSDGTPYIKYTTGPNANYGTVYTVVGSSSKTGNLGGDGQLDHPVMYTGNYILGSIALEITGDTLNAYFIDTNAAVFDNFTIIKVEDTTTGIDQSVIYNHQSLIVYPNPFSDKVQVHYTLNASGFVSLEIYNIFGQKVYTVVEEKQKRGKYSYIVDISATVLSKGVYVLQLKSEEILNVKKIIKF